MEKKFEFDELNFEEMITINGGSCDPCSPTC